MRAARIGAARGSASPGFEAPRATRSTSPPARACTSTLPSAVASTGPASTRQPGAVGRALAEQLVQRAAADDVDRAHVDAADASGLVRGVGERLRERSDDAARVLGSGARSRHAVLASTTRRCGRACRPAEGSEGRSTSKTGPSPSPLLPNRSSVGRSMRCPARSHVRTASLSTQSPMTLCRSRTLPSTPPSFVKFASRAASVSDRASSLDADQPPRAARDVGRGIAAASAPRRPPRPCRASRPR